MNKNKLNNRGRTVFYAVMMALPLLQFLVFYVFVNFNSLLMAFQEYIPEKNSFVFSLLSIKQVAADFAAAPEIRYSLKNTLIWVAVQLLVATPLSLIFSYYIFKKFPLSRMFKIFLFLPQIISGIVMAILFKFIAELGVPELWNLLFGKEIMGLFENPATTFGTVVFFNLWIGFGTNILIYVSAMENIPESVMEYSRLDGTKFFAEFGRIVFPMIYQTFITFIVIILSGAFAGQLSLYSFFGGTAEMRLYTMGYYLYIETQKATMVQYPYLAALGIIITLIIAPVTLAVKKLLTIAGRRYE